MNKKVEFESKTSDEIVCLLKSVAENEGFRNYKIEKIDEGMKGEGYLGIITSVQIENDDKVNGIKTLNLVIKSASKSEALRREAPISSIYNREIYMYNRVFPTFRLLEAEKRLPPSTFTAKFYKGENTDKRESIVLENLKDCGFKLYDRKIPMNDDHVSLVLSQYGRLHALSFALRDQDYEKFKQIVGSMNDVFLQFTDQANLKGSIIQRCVKVQKVLALTLTRNALDVYENFITEIPNFLEELRNSTDEYSVILHGDAWTNNMMFRYKNENGVNKLSDMRFLDFQLSRLGPPVLDLAYFLYSCSSKEIMDRLDHYLELYYTSLSSYLQELGSNPDELYPYSVLRQQWKKYAKFGLFMSLIVMHVMLSEKEETVDLASLTESGQHLDTAFSYKLAKTAVYNERAKHVILHFIKNNLI